MLKRNYRILAIFLAIALLLACAPIAVATPPVAPPTFDLLSLNTIIAQTAAVAATQTFVLLPTLTPSPTITKTPTEIPSSTPTFIFVLSTPTVPSSTPTLNVSSERFACRVISQAPEDNSVLVKGIPFKAHWQVINIGTLGWDQNSLDYRYVSGDKLHMTSAYDFNQSVPTGGVIDFFVEMQAPNQPGTYQTTWKIAIGKERFCTMNLTIVVN
jgi:hypothetical protein